MNDNRIRLGEKNKQNDILVSIIIPVYNVRPYLSEALDSVLQQSFENIEIICVDDGSTDGSGEICEWYAKKDTRVTVFHQENKGLSAARNAGLEIMTGDVVAFLDSDDTYDPDYIKKMLSAMIQEKTDIVVCKYTVHDTTEKMEKNGKQDQKPAIMEGIYDRDSALRALIDGELNVSLWNKLYRRELWNYVRFPEGHVYEEQKTILSIIELSVSIYVLDQSLYYYRKRPGSITRTKKLSNYRDLVYAYSYLDTYVTNHIPEIFSQEQAERSRQSLISILINIYIQCSRYNDKESAYFCENLKEQIIKKGRENNKYFSMRTKIEYYLLCTFPWLLKLMYLSYYSIRMRLLKCLKRKIVFRLREGKSI